MTSGHHDTLVHRLAQILIKLNQGERLDPQTLADEFAVNLRTIQRDLNERLAYLPLVRTSGVYQLDPVFLGRLSTRDIDRFASLAGVRGLFPSLSDEFLKDIFDIQVQSAFLVKGHHYEDLTDRRAEFRQLEDAIVQRHHVAFDYRKPEGPKRYSPVAPFRLVNNKGIWYLVAREGERVKTFSFSKLSQIRTLESSFPPDPALNKRLDEEDDTWFGENPQEVILKVSSEVAGYFRRRRLIANQVIVKDLEDGSLLLSANVGHPNQVLPIVRYWIPHIRIISPEGMQSDLDKVLAQYLSGTKDNA